jgi:ATP synthase F1 complex assembly factor 1
MGATRKRSFSSTPAPPRELGQVVRLDTLQHETPDRIRQLWIDYHTKKASCVSAVAPADTYALLHRRLTESPLFVLPLPREAGFVSVLLQADAHQDAVIFTDLESYRQAADKGAVPAALHLRYYTELAKQKHIVLVRGELDPTRLTATEAQTLVNQLQVYYLADAKYETYVKRFNHDPAHFDYNAVLEDLRSGGGL